ncbi:MAG TPA: hypothetical protein DEV78_01110 [Clostridiales bacterium]|nr:hypothetical protein [Clostridiales bacterium]
MANQKKEKQEIKTIRNIGFWTVNVIMTLILVTSIVLELLNKKNIYIDFQNDQNIVNSLGVASQIISAVVTCILSTIGISFSLQNNEYFHIKVRDINAMRVRKHYSYLFTFLFNLILLFGNILCYCVSWYILNIGMGLISTIFCITVLIQEIPILTQNQQAYLDIFKDRFIVASYSANGDSFSSTDYLRNEFDNALEDLIKQKNLITVYEYFTIKDKPKYNKKVLLKLLDIQQFLAFKLKYIDDQKELNEICDNLKSNILDVFLGELDIISILGENYQNYQHYLTRVVFQLVNCTEKIASEISDEIIDVIFYRNFDNNEIEKEFLLSVLIAILTSVTINNNILFLESIKKKYSTNYFSLSSNSVSTLFFAIISVYLYYLVEKQNEISSGLKNKLTEFINESYIRDNFECLSWRKLFEQFVSEFSVNYNELISVCLNNQYYLRNINFGPFAKTVIFTKNFLTNWYLAMLFNSERVYNFDFEKDLFTEYNYYLKNFVEDNFDNIEFKPTKELQETASFYLGDCATFNCLKATLRSDSNFLYYYKRLAEKKLDAEADACSKVNKEDLANKYRPIICSVLTSDYGFDQNIDLSDEKEKCITVMSEKTSQAVNQDECLTNAFIDGVFYDMWKSINYEIIKKDDKFDTNITQLLSKDIDKYTGYLTVCEYYLSNESVKSDFMSKVNSLERVKSKVLKDLVLILKDGYKYNISVNDFLVEDLSEMQLNNEVDKYKRADGQYVYEGLFLPREKIAKLINNKYAVFTIIFKYKIETYPGALIKIDLFPKE